MDRLDALLDLVFRRLLVQEPALLVDLLEGVLERPIAEVTLVDPSSLAGGRLLGEHGLAIDVTLANGAHLDVRMMVPNTKDEANQLVFGSYGSPDPMPTPTAVVMWLRTPLVPSSGRLHSIFEFSERTSFLPLGDGFEVHAIDLLELSPSGATGDEGKLERWARFFVARDQGLLDALAAEDPIMATALRHLDQLSADPELRRLADERRATLAAAR
ncbi:hypothetical protein [Paraliomyxa miuraensis]|uniref:hypothetical protein n=1 Tax=Paraliomyxa miuraensis TaxID=376150 RepID=UPI00224D5043|nr:hypothetical protein [Paraliomyxa miuraensis]MCX4239278.1 hypothetical protein [Paraliomyxa miuraensis]